MTRTVLSSAAKEIVIGFDAPFCVIGRELIQRVASCLQKKWQMEIMTEFSQMQSHKLRPELPCSMLMLEYPLANEPKILAESIQLIQSFTDIPLSIDSSIVEALEAGLAVYQGKALVNSVTGEEERLEVVLPLVKKYGAAVVAISNDETGISEDPNEI